MTSSEVGAGPPLRWGVIGANSMVAQRAVLPAIGASSRARLVAIASERGSPPPVPPGVRAHRSYAALLDDPDVEAVYIPLPNALHREWVERAAAAGKHVLCEKPLAPTAADARAMAAACRAAGVVLVEAYVTPFHPRTAAIAALIRSGRLGPLRFARAAFTSVLDRAGDHRWQPAMAGGALLDVGTYCVAPLIAAAGRLPERVHAAATRSESGVDRSCAGWLDFGDGFTAAIECSFEAPERQLLEIAGTEGAVSVDRAFTPGPADDRFALRGRDGRTEVVIAGAADPYRAMVEHVADVIRGRREPIHGIGDSIAVSTVLDRLREAARAAPAAPADGGAAGRSRDGSVRDVDEPLARRAHVLEQ